MINAILKFDSKVARFFHSSEREREREIRSEGRETARGKEIESGGDYFGKTYFNFHLKLNRQRNYFGKYLNQLRK